MIKKWFKQRNRAITFGLILGVVMVFLPFIVFAIPFEDNFDTYDLGDLAGQGDWVLLYGTSPEVVSEGYSDKGVFIPYQFGGATRIGATTTEGTLSFQFKIIQETPNGEAVAFRITDDEEKGIYLDFNCVSDDCSNGVSAEYLNDEANFISLGVVSPGAWHEIKINWTTDTNKAKYQLEGFNWTDWEGWLSPSGKGLSKIWFQNPGTMFYMDAWFDEIEESKGELKVWVNPPASGGTATSTFTNFTINWEGWDFEDIYKDFVFSFYEKNTGILTGTKIYTPTATSGFSVVKFSDFGIDKNGTYYFHAKARSYLYEYTAYYTGDLVSPEWWVKIDVEGWQQIFEMPEFETWYSENSKFATPTAIFTGITTFISPIFNKIGEFGNQVVVFLDLNEAYDRGYDLGKIIPLFRHYVSEIEVFFGGFPIIQIFLAFLIILLGIFIIRLILKFIPGLG